MFAFISLLFILLVIFALTSRTEPFTDKAENKSEKGELNIPKIPDAAPSLLSDVKDVSPHTVPGELPTAPYGQIASMNPLPYQDTTMIKTNTQQIMSLLETLKAFLTYEAQELETRSDPNIQLPLSNAKADLQVLQNAADLLHRNPGLQPTMTLTQWN